MCCLVATLFALGPRAAILVWWLLEPVRISAAFDTAIWPLLGFLFLPWTTLMYLVVFPGGITGLDIVWLGIAVAMDAFAWFGGGYTNRGRIQQTAPDRQPAGTSLRVAPAASSDMTVPTMFGP